MGTQGLGWHIRVIEPVNGLDIPRVERTFAFSYDESPAALKCWKDAQAAGFDVSIRQVMRVKEPVR